VPTICEWAYHETAVEYLGSIVSPAGAALPAGRRTVGVVERALRDPRSSVERLPAGFRFPDLRHYFASLPIASGLDIKTVQARLRHASAKTTLDTYGHLWPDRDESSKAAVASIFGERPQQRPEVSR
jgi:integrase